MRRIRIMGLCLVAVFAFSALVASATQAAEPEWGQCVKLAKAKGKYADPNCKERSGKLKGKPPVLVPNEKGAYEWLPGAETKCYNVKKKAGKYTDAGCTVRSGKLKGKPPVFVPNEKGEFEKTAGGPKFTGKGGAGVLTTVIASCTQETQPEKQLPRQDCEGENGHAGYLAISATAKVECTSETATGEATGSDEVGNVSVRFEGCTFSGLPATTVGLPAGEIQVNQLKGRLGYINKATHEVGVLLEPAAPGGLFADFETLGGELSVRVGVGDPATTGSFYEEIGPEPTGNDGVISSIVPVNHMTHTFTQNYRTETTEVPCPTWCGIEGKLNVQVNKDVPSSFEGGKFEALESYLYNAEGAKTEWSGAGQELTNVSTVEGEAEIKA